MSLGSTLVRLVSVMLAALALAAGTAVAQDTEVCRGHVGDTIAACTRVINSSRSTREQVGDAFINRGQHYYEKKEYDRAIEDFNRAIPLKPRWVQMAYGNRGNAYYAKDEKEKALDSYDKAIELDPQYASALTARGMIYEEMGIVERAKSDFRAALKANAIFSDTKWAHDTARKHLDDLGER